MRPSCTCRMTPGLSMVAKTCVMPPSTCPAPMIRPSFSSSSTPFWMDRTLVSAPITGLIRAAAGLGIERLDAEEHEVGRELAVQPLDGLGLHHPFPVHGRSHAQPVSIHLDIRSETVVCGRPRDRGRLVRGPPGGSMRALPSPTRRASQRFRPPLFPLSLLLACAALAARTHAQATA